MIRDPFQMSFPGTLAFVRTVELGNFSRAAKALHVTPAAVSRAVARLEDSLGVRLFQRSTRALVATHQGLLYFERSAQALALLSDAREALSTTHLNGRVRLSVPTTYGVYRLMPHVAAFRTMHPALELEIQISNETVDFVREGYDLAIRMGEIEDASLVARKLGDFSVGVFASVHHLKRVGIPPHPRELEKHECLVFVLPRSGRVLPWIFKNFVDVVPSSKTKILSDPLGAVVAAQHGAGFVQSYHFIAQPLIRSGQLKEVLQSFAGRTRKFSLVHLKEATRSPSVKAVANWILECAKL
jgi:DNA-binding transcriptional LysR family regulator